MTDSINALNADLFGVADERADRDPATARKKAMDFLARREYGHAELVGRLQAAGYTQSVAAEAVDALTADGLQDDRRFASSFLSARVSRGSGPLRIASALKERGVAAAIVDQALAECEADWNALAREVRDKKYGLGVPASYKDKARQLRFLQYRGFGMEHIRYALGES